MRHRQAQLLLSVVGSLAVSAACGPGGVETSLVFPSASCEVVSSTPRAASSDVGTTGWSAEDIASQWQHDGVATLEGKLAWFGTRDVEFLAVLDVLSPGEDQLQEWDNGEPGRDSHCPPVVFRFDVAVQLDVETVGIVDGVATLTTLDDGTPVSLTSDPPLPPVDTEVTITLFLK